jgi:hypothetical protein
VKRSVLNTTRGGTLIGERVIGLLQVWEKKGNLKTVSSCKCLTQTGVGGDP